MDYPVDGGDGMSQVFHGEKMLLESPSPPAARVNGNIYFVNELLQECSGAYFVPEHFFNASYAASNPGDLQDICQRKELELYAMGRAVQYTDVCSSVLHIPCLTMALRSSSPSRRPENSPHLRAYET